MTAGLSLDRATVRYRRVLMQVRYALEASAVPSDIRRHVYKLIDDVLENAADPPKHVHR